LVPPPPVARVPPLPPATPPVEEVPPVPPVMLTPASAPPRPPLPDGLPGEKPLHAGVRATTAVARHRKRTNETLEFNTCPPNDAGAVGPYCRRNRILVVKTWILSQNLSAQPRPVAPATGAQATRAGSASRLGSVKYRTSAVAAKAAPSP